MASFGMEEAAGGRPKRRRITASPRFERRHSKTYVIGLLQGFGSNLGELLRLPEICSAKSLYQTTEFIEFKLKANKSSEISDKMLLGECAASIKPPEPFAAGISFLL
ncbi:hypothetical protein Q3G72_010042 [Acer saccharum]|nr:hypothetical protein Q3G72_010042 [Acer saccharum]